MSDMASVPMDLKEKVAYLQGLAQGLKIDSEAPEGRVLNEVIDVLAHMSRAVYDLKGTQQEMESYLEEVDQDLSVVEDDLYGDDDDDEPEAVEVKCPNCGTVLHVERLGGDDDSLDLICPNCGEMIYDTDSDLDWAADDDRPENGSSATTGAPDA